MSESAPSNVCQSRFYLSDHRMSQSLGRKRMPSATTRATTVLLLALVALCAVATLLCGGSTVLVVGLSGIVALNGAAYWCSDRLVCALTRAIRHTRVRGRYGERAPQRRRARPGRRPRCDGTRLAATPERAPGGAGAPVVSHASASDRAHCTPARVTSGRPPSARCAGGTRPLTARIAQSPSPPLSPRSSRSPPQPSPRSSRSPRP